MKFPLVFALSLALSLMSCSTSKKIPAKEVTYTTEDVLVALKDHNHAFEWFHGKGSAKIAGFGQSHHVQTIIRMRADSAIWVLFKKFEIEAIRVLMTPDDYTVLYRLEGGYMKGSTDELKQEAGMDVPYGELQNWLFGNVVIPVTKEVQLTQDEHTVTLQFLHDHWFVTYEIDKMTRQLISVNMKDMKGNIVAMKFGDYKYLESGENIAHFRDIDITSSTGEKAKLTLDFSEIEVNVPKELKFVVPSHYSEFE